MANNTCEGGGFLVDAAGFIPSDVSEFHAKAYPWVFGCNQLFCPACGEWVRNAGGVALDFDWPGAASAANALYDRADLATAPHAQSSDKPRLYLCRCLWRNELGATLLESERESEAEPSRWVCKGHPAPSLPLEVDGVALEIGCEVERLVHDALRGALAPRAPGGLVYQRPWQWLVRAYVRLLRSADGGGLAAELARAAARAIDATDPGVQAGVLRFFTTFADAPGAEALVQLAQGERKRLAGVRNPYPEFGDQDTLEDRLILFVHLRAEKGDADALEVLRREASQARQGADRALFALAALDQQWLLSHAVEIVRRHPLLAAPLLMGVKLKCSTRLAEVVQALAPLPGVDARTLTRYGAKAAPAEVSPLRIDANNTFAPATDFAELVRASLLGGGTLPATKHDAAPLDSVERAYRAVVGTPYEPRFARGVLACTVDPDPAVRGQALLFFETFRDATGRGALVRLALEHAELFAGVDNPMMPSRDLEWQLLRSLSAGFFEGDAEALALGRQAALDGRGEPVIAALAQVDPQWVTAHASEIVARTPSLAVAMLMNLPAAQRAAVGERIAREADRDPNFRQELDRFIDDAGVKRRVLAALE